MAYNECMIILCLFARNVLRLFLGIFSYETYLFCPVITVDDLKFATQNADKLAYNPVL